MSILDYFSKELAEKSLKISQMVATAGAKAYLVGGCVRDGLLNLAVNDADIEVYGITLEDLQILLLKEFRLDLVGKQFAVLKLQKINIDISVPRVESKYGTGHKAFKVETQLSISPLEASLRRDFTVNSILYDPLTNELIDNYRGIEDLHSGVLRHVSGKFSEDPLRVLRAMQFIARFNFKVASETVELCKEIDQNELPRERIFEEWKKMLLKGKYISPALEFLRSVGWLKYYSELEALVCCPQDKIWHPEGSVWDHTLLCLNAFALLKEKNNFSQQENLMLGLSVLCHDLGKSTTTFFEAGRVKSPGHEITGLDLTDSFLAKLTNQTDLIDQIKLMVRHHMQPYALFKEKAGQAAIRRLSNKVKRLDYLIEVCKADYIGCGREFTTDIEHLSWMQNQAEELGLKDQAPKAIVMGRHLMDYGVKPGLAYKEILHNCFEAQLTGKFSDLDGATIYLKELLKSKKLI